MFAWQLLADKVHGHVVIVTAKFPNPALHPDLRRREVERLEVPNCIGILYFVSVHSVLVLWLSGSVVISIATSLPIRVSSINQAS